MVSVISLDAPLSDTCKQSGQRRVPAWAVDGRGRPRTWRAGSGAAGSYHRKRRTHPFDRTYLARHPPHLWPFLAHYDEIAHARLQMLAQQRGAAVAPLAGVGAARVEPGNRGVRACERPSGRRGV